MVTVSDKVGNIENRLTNRVESLDFILCAAGIQKK